MVYLLFDGYGFTSRALQSILTEACLPPPVGK